MDFRTCNTGNDEMHVYFLSSNEYPDTGMGMRSPGTFTTPGPGLDGSMRSFYINRSDPSLNLNGTLLRPIHRKALKSRKTTTSEQDSDHLHEVQ